VEKPRTGRLLRRLLAHAYTARSLTKLYDRGESHECSLAQNLLAITVSLKPFQHRSVSCTMKNGRINTPAHRNASSSESVVPETDVKAYIRMVFAESAVIAVKRCLIDACLTFRHKLASQISSNLEKQFLSVFVKIVCRLLLFDCEMQLLKSSCLSCIGLWNAMQRCFLV